MRGKFKEKYLIKPNAQNRLYAEKDMDIETIFLNTFQYKFTYTSCK